MMMMMMPQTHLYQLQLLTLLLTLMMTIAGMVQMGRTSNGDFSTVRNYEFFGGEGDKSVLF